MSKVILKKKPHPGQIMSKVILKKKPHPGQVMSKANDADPGSQADFVIFD